LGTSGYYCVYNGNGSNVTLSNLLPNTQYTVQVFEYNGTTGNEQYNTRTVTGNPNSFTTLNTTEVGEINKDVINIYSYGKTVYIISKNPESAEITLIDVTGKSLYSHKINKTESSIDLSDYPAGIYIIKYKSNSNLKTHKLCLLD
jgi:hypothetical protein